MTPDAGSSDGTDTEWEWRVYPKEGLSHTKRKQEQAATPSLVVNPSGSASFNETARGAIADDDTDPADLDYIRYLVAEYENLVGFVQTDEDDPDGYKLGDSNSTSLQAVLTTFGFDKPDESVMLELHTDDAAPAPYVDLSGVERGYTDSGGGE